jgi:hypothetical protein
MKSNALRIIDGIRIMLAFPFDPIKRSSEVEKIVMQGNKKAQLSLSIRQILWWHNHS